MPDISDSHAGNLADKQGLAGITAPQSTPDSAKNQSTGIVDTSDLTKMPEKEASVSEKAALPSGEKAEQFTTFGEKLHNEMTYRGVDLFLNSAIGVAVTYWSNKTKSGEKYFKEPVANLFKFVLRNHWKKALSGAACLPASFLVEQRLFHL